MRRSHSPQALAWGEASFDFRNRFNGFSNIDRTRHVDLKLLKQFPFIWATGHPRLKPAVNETVTFPWQCSFSNRQSGDGQCELTRRRNGRSNESRN